MPRAPVGSPSTRASRARSAGARRRPSSGRSATARWATCSATTRAGTRSAASSRRSRASRSTRTSRSWPRCSRCASAPCARARGSILEAKISDGTGILTLTFFNQAWRARELVPGRPRHLRRQGGRLQGRAPARPPRLRAVRRRGRRSPRAMPPRKRWAEAPIPIYPATGALASWQLAKSIALLLDGLGDVDDPVPAGVRQARTPARPAARARGASTVQRSRPTGRRRGARCASPRRSCCRPRCCCARAELRAHTTTARHPSAGGLLERFDASLPFSLTGDQQEVGAEIADDLEHPVPMNRLVQGEVGSGKTVVALRAMLAVADSGGQSALLAPTEVLAAQHLRSIARMLGPDLSASVVPTLLTGQLPAAERRKALLARRCRPVAHRRRHARAHRRRRVVRRPRARRRRRAAPVRGRAARGAAAQGAASAARARAHRDAHPAHRRDDGVRRPRRLDDPRAAGRPRRHRVPRGAARRASRLAPARLGAARRGGRAGPAGIRRVPGDRGPCRRGRRRGARGRRRGGCRRARGIRRLGARRAHRAPALRGQAGRRRCTAA